MGYSEDPRTSEKQPEKGALDTNQDKSLEENQTPKTEEETGELTPREESEGSEAESIEGATPKEEEKVKAEAEIEEDAVEKAEKEAEEGVSEETEEEAEEKKERREKQKEKEEEEIVEERTYTIPLRRAWISPRKKRAPRALHIVESFIKRHMKVEPGTKAGEEEEEQGRLVISNEVNEKLWSRGIEKPPRNIRIRAVKDKEGIVTLYLAKGD